MVRVLGLESHQESVVEQDLHLRAEGIRMTKPMTNPSGKSQSLACECTGVLLIRNEGMEKKIDATIVSYIGTTIRIPSFIPN